jgi:hypothetical protein
MQHVLKHGMHIKFVFHNLEGKTPLEGPRHRWESDIKMDLWKQICEDVNMVMDQWVS